MSWGFEFAITLLWRVTDWIYIQDILSLSLACGALFAWIYLHTPIQWEHVLLGMVAGCGALVMIVWFVISI